MKTTADTDFEDAAFSAALGSLTALGVATEVLSTLPPRLRGVEPESDESLWADRLLAWACLCGDRRAIEFLTREHIRPVAAVLAARGAPSTQIEPVLQDLNSHLLVGDRAALHGYSGRGSLGAFVRTAGLRLWLGERRSDDRRSAREELALALEPTSRDDPELRFIQETHAEQYREALHAAWERLAPNLRLVLRQHLVGGMSIDAIAAFHRIHRSSAARRVTAARDALVDDSKRILAERLGLDDRDVQSILRLIRSRLELKLEELS